MIRMISIDTNILVRLLTCDDKEQAARAKCLFLDEHIYITKTVILETEWVLRYAYAFSAATIAGAFVKLLGQQNVTHRRCASYRPGDKTAAKGTGFCRCFASGLFAKSSLYHLR